MKSRAQYSGTFDSFVSSVDRPIERTGTDGADFWSKSDPIITGEGAERKLVRGGMFSPQRQWWTLPNFIKLLVGGYGSGKTLVACKRAIASALQNAPAPVAVVSPTFPQARHTVIATLEALLSGKQTHYGPRQFWYRYNKSTHEFRIRFKGRNALIIVYSGEDPASLKGPNLGAAYIDEPFIQDLAVFDQMVARVRHPDAPNKEIGLTGTPEQLNWGYDLCMGELKDRHDVGFVQASTRLNKALDDGYIKRLEGSFTDKAAAAYIEGSFVQLGTGLIYYAFGGMGSANVCEIEIPQGAELGVGMDFNVNPFACVAFWRAGPHLHFFKEFEFENADTEYVCQVLREKFVEDDPDKRIVPRGYTLRTIYPDASGAARHTASPSAKSDFWYIKQAGFQIDAPTANPLVRDRENAVNGKFKPKVGQATLTVCPKGCKKLVKYLSTQSHELKTKQQKQGHLLDAFGYPIHRLFPVSKDTLSVHRISGS